MLFKSVIFLQLQRYLDEDIYELFTRKLAEWNLQQREDFVWCANVSVELHLAIFNRKLIIGLQVHSTFIIKKLCSNSNSNSKIQIYWFCIGDTTAVNFSVMPEVKQGLTIILFPQV